MLFLISIKTKNSHTQPIEKPNNKSKQQYKEFPDFKQKKLKILSWNIYMLPYINFLNNNELRAQSIGELLRHEDFNIIVFQEAFYEKSRKIIYDELKENYPYQYGPFNAENHYFETNSGLWILSKIPLNIVKTIKYRNAKGFDAIANKGAVLLEGLFNNKKFQLVATHLQAENYSQIRKEQIKQLAQELSHPFKKENIPQIFCGDFNIRPFEFSDYNFMLEELGATNDLMFSFKNISYDEIKNELAKTKNPIPATLDYILISREFNKIINLERSLLKFKAYLSFDKTIELSDHYAISAKISL